MTRRRRLVVMTVGAGAAITLVAAAAVWWTRDRGETYVPGERVEGVTDTLSRGLPEDHPPIHFTDVTAEAGITFRHFSGTRSSQLPEDMGSGAAWGDVDGDADPDLLLVNFSGPLGPDGKPPAAAETMAAVETGAADPPTVATHRLYRNRGDGTFEDATGPSGVGVPGCGMAAAFADADGDRDLDLVVTQFGHSLFFLNRGDGTFDNASRDSGIAKAEGFWSGASWCDFDRDGDLDLYVCGYVRYQRKKGVEGKTTYQYQAEIPFALNPSSFSPERNLLLCNDGTGRFEDVAEASGVRNLEGRSLSATWADLDEDGWPDLYVANDVSDNALFLNQGDGTFEDRSHQAWVADYRGAMGLGLGDFDGDGDFDLFVSHWIAQENALYVSLLRENEELEEGEGGGAKQANLRFADQADMQGLGQIALDKVGWGGGFLDYDLDGRLDLFVANGSTFQNREDPTRLIPQRDFLFWNTGKTRGFFDVGPACGLAFDDERVGRGAAFADYDGDGDPDILVTNHGASPRLLRNDGGEKGSWLTVRLEGRRSNRTGIGARVEIEAGGRRQVRVVGGQSSYLSQSELVAHFGLGGVARADTLRVRWPSGWVDELHDVPARKSITVVEAKKEFYTRYAKAKRERLDGNLEAAAADYERALELYPRHEDTLYWLGTLRLELDRYDGAREAYEKLVRENPLSARGHQQLGVLFATHEEGAPFDLDRAEAALRRALEVNPEESGPMVRLGEVLLVKGDTDEALHLLDAATRLNPRATSGHYLCGYLLWKKGRGDEAVERLRRAAGSLEKEALPVKGATAEGDTGERLRRLQHEARRKSLFGPLWHDLRDRLDPSAVDAAAAGEEYARVDEFVGELRSPA